MKIWKKYPTTQGCLTIIFIALVFFVVMFVFGYEGIEFSSGFFIGTGGGLILCFIIDFARNRKDRKKQNEKI